jgi:hypothetical protein
MTCKKCKNSFPRFIEIDGKQRNLSSRKYCLNCSPFGKHNTREIHDNMVSEKICKRCSKPSGRRRNFCNSCNVTRYRQNLKKKLVDYKGGKCEICGYNKCMRNLIFHHIDPSEKEFAITTNLMSLKKMKIEVDKCSLLCCLCHGEVHEGLISI